MNLLPQAYPRVAMPQSRQGLRRWVGNHRVARICLIRQFYVPLDTRVRREVAALVDHGHQVDVICLRRPGEQFWERRGQLTIWRLPLPRPTGAVGRRALQYLAFLFSSGLLAGVLCLRRRFDVVQVNTVPDPLVFAAAVPRLLGARVLLDLHECVPEFYAAKFNTPIDSLGPRFMAALEQASIRFADFAITCTDQMRERFMARGTPSEKVGVVLNGADEEVFNPLRLPSAAERERHFCLISHGTLEERYGLDTLVRAVSLLKDEIPHLRVSIIGEGSYRSRLEQLVVELGITEHVSLSPGFLPLDDLVRAIADADVGVVAIKRDDFRDLTLCNKMYDFIAMRTPAIASRTRSVEDYFGDDCFEMFESGDEHDLARAIRTLHEHPERQRQLVGTALAAAEGHRWPRQRENYLAVVERLARQTLVGGSSRRRA